MRIWSLLPCALLAVASPARADVDAAAAPAPTTSPHWYGGRLLLADGASLAVLMAGGTQEDLPLMGLGVAGLLVASPILHATHDNLAKGLLSLVVRVALPGAGYLIAKGTSDGCWRQPGASDACDVIAEIGGVFVGAFAAELVDVVFLARDTHRVEPVAPPRAPVAPPPVQLVLAPQSGGAMMGLSGRF